MKKLVSICFLSILFSMFSVQAQDCCFRLNNPNGPTLTNIANMPGGLQVNHQLTPMATMGRTDVYDLVFSDANCLGIDYATGKVSIEWELWCDGHQVTTDLSDYCTMSFQTRYNELRWIGGNVATGTSQAQDYPGAIQQYQGTFNVSNIAFDYFYFQFLANTKSRVVITWNQAIHDVMLVVRVRERINGTNNELYWNDGQNLNIGGHQSQPGRILAVDTLNSDPYPTAERVINDCEDVVVGKPAFTLHNSGTYIIAYVDTACGNRIDSIVTYDYTHYVHPTTPSVADVVYCQYETAEAITLPIDSALLDHADQIVAYWSTDAENFVEQESFTPPTDVTGYFTYYVKRHDNLTGCESEVQAFHSTINVLPGNPVANDPIVEYCVGDAAVALMQLAPAGQIVLWGTSSDNITSEVAPIPATTTAGTQVYFMRMKNSATGCLSLGYDSVVVNVYDNPVPVIDATLNTLCYGEKTVLSTTESYNGYEWSLKGFVLDTAATYTFVNNEAATDTLLFQVIVTENHPEVACKAKGSKEILAYTKINQPSAVRGDTALCGPGMTTRTVTVGDDAVDAVWYNASDEVLGTGLSYTANYDVTTTIYVAAKNEYGCETETAERLPVTITVNSVPVVTITPNPGKVCAESDLLLTVTPTPGTYAAPMSYDWSDAGASATGDTYTFNKAVAGEYQVSVKGTDDNGCFSFDTTTVNVDTLPIIEIGVDYTVTNNDYCVGFNGSIVFITSYVQYSIDNGLTWSTNGSFNSLPAETYFLRVEDGNGCVNNPADTVVIIDAPVMPVVTTTNEGNTQCVAPFNGKLIATATPAAVYNYSIGGPFQADSVFTELSHEYTYTVVAKDITTGCTDTAFNQVVADNRPVMLITADIDSNTHCYSPYDGKITVDVEIQDERQATYTYTLSGSMTRPVQFSNVFDTLIHGNYTVLVKETISGCETSADFVVADERATVTLDLTQTPNEHCLAPFNGTITVDAAPASGTYMYSIDGGVTYQASPVFEALEQGNYTVTAKDIFTFCEGSADITVTYAGVLPTAKISANDNICFGDTTKVSLVTSGDVVFDEWTYSGPVSDSVMIAAIAHQQTFALPDFPAGKHNFTAHFHDTVTHCSNTASKEIRVIPVNIDLLRVTSSTICDLDTAEVYCKYFPDDVSDSLISYTWYAHNWYYSKPLVFDSIMVIPTSAKNRVSIVVTDNHGCTNSKYIDLLVHEWPNIVVSGDTDYCKNTSADITASSSHSIATYEWWKGAVKQSSTAAYEANVGELDYSLTLKLVDNLGCKNDTTININVVDIPGAPVFDPSTQYFCSNETINVDTTVRDIPNLGSFVWNASNPNIDQVPGTYTAHYTYTEGAATCNSADSSVTVVVNPAPHFDVDMKYNGVSATSHTRCYEASPSTESLSFSVTPAPSSEYTYVYTKNGSPATPPMTITRTDAGTYVDTINIEVTRHNPGDVECKWDTTLYFTLTINPLPTEPSNFPTYDVAGYKSIFRCEGTPASYDFTTGTSDSLSYKVGYGSYTTTVPYYATEVITLKATDTNSCENTFEYKLVEVKNPSTVTVSTSLDDAYCGSSSVTGDFYAKVDPGTLAQTYNVLTYNWCDSAAVHPSSILYDTLYNATFYTDTTVSVSVTVKAGGSDQYSVTCGPKTGSKAIDFQIVPTIPVLSTSVSGYVDSANVGYCTNGDTTSPTSVSIAATDFTTTPSTGVTIKVVGGSFPITAPGVYKIHAQNDDGLHCSSDTLTLTVTKYREILAPENYVTNIYYCSNDTAVVPFVAKNADDSLAYYSGDTYLDTVPKTAGSYYVKVVDKQHNQCFLKKNFVITSVTTPTLTVELSGDSLRKLCEGSTIGALSATPHYNTNPATTNVVYYWNGSAAAGASSSTFGAISADSTIIVKAIATNTELSTPCASLPAYDQIEVKHFATPSIPTYTGDTAFCAGDTLEVVATDFTYTYGDTLISMPVLPTKFIAAGGSVTAYTTYADLLSCKSTSTTVTITRNTLPTVNVSPSTKTVCIGASATFTASGALTYSWDNGDTNSSITVDTVRLYTVTGTDVNGCTNTATAELLNWPEFTVNMSNDTLVCKDEPLALTCVPSVSPCTYQWFLDGTQISGGVDSTILPSTSVLSPMVGGLPVPYVYSLKVTDEHGCVSPSDSNVVNVYVFDNALFTFLPSDEISTTVGTSNSFTMRVNKNCMNPGTTVFLQFSIYKDGVLLTNEEWNTCVNALPSGFNTTYDIDLTTNAPLLAGTTMDNVRYTTATGNIPEAKLFPTMSTHTFHWFYMHFLNERNITVNIGSWKEPGTYKVVYVLRQTSSLISPDMIPYQTGPMLVGGSGGISGAPVDTLSMDWITFYVEGTSSNPNPTPTSISTLEDASVMNMQVYPNPAQSNVNVVLEGVQGQTMITIYDMSGKVVSSERIEVSYNGQIYTTSVNNYSQGIYFVKVVNGDAVMTKKLIIAR